MHARKYKCSHRKLFNTSVDVGVLLEERLLGACRGGTICFGALFVFRYTNSKKVIRCSTVSLTAGS